MEAKTTITIRDVEWERTREFLMQAMMVTFSIKIGTVVITDLKPAKIPSDAVEVDNMAKLNLSLVATPYEWTVSNAFGGNYSSNETTFYLWVKEDRLHIYI